MKIVCISDIHGQCPIVPKGDLFIIAGDLTRHDRSIEYLTFRCWLQDLEFKQIIVIAGNHDSVMQKKFLSIDTHKVKYLQDAEFCFNGLKIWGSPWTKRFMGQNPDATAFSLFLNADMKDRWNLIPNDVDILITHTPPVGIGDQPKKQSTRCGDEELLYKYQAKAFKPMLHVFGHIHGGHGEYEDERFPGTVFVNASHMNEHYEPVNKPIVIEI